MIIDICSGFGGGTQAFDDVIRIDIDPKVKPDIVADVRYLPLSLGLRPDLLWMSPPCEKLSRADRTFPRPGSGDALRMVAACLDAICYLKPKKWIIENPKGHLEDFIPDYVATVKYPAYDMKNKTTRLWSNMKSLKRAFIPRHISQSIKDYMVEEHHLSLK